jgi:hypothetical protein
MSACTVMMFQSATLGHNVAQSEPAARASYIPRRPSLPTARAYANDSRVLSGVDGGSLFLFDDGMANVPRHALVMECTSIKNSNYVTA